MGRIGTVRVRLDSGNDFVGIVEDWELIPHPAKPYTELSLKLSRFGYGELTESDIKKSGSPIRSFFSAVIDRTAKLANIANLTSPEK